MKKMRRLLVLCLAIVMCIGTAIPAFATNSADAGAYVEQLYNGLLGRSADDSGKSLYVSMILNNGANGATIAEAIATSTEFRSKAYSDEEFVKAIYLGVLGREADAEGLKTFTDALKSGRSRSWVLQQILSSLEFTSVCLKYGMYVGSVSSSSTINASSTAVNSNLAEDYVMRLYYYMLGRDGSSDPEGVAMWTKKLTDRQMSAAGVAAAIASSTEFSNRSLSDGQYVQILYYALLNREVDANGWKTWLTALTNGRSRSWVLSSICASAEFKNMFREMNATVGSVSSASYTVSANNVNEAACYTYVKRLYVNLLGRSNPSDADVEDWVDILVARQMSAAGVAAAIASSSEARKWNLNHNQYEFLECIYWALLDRAPDASGQKTYTKALSNGYSRAWVFTKICASTEFQNRSEFSTMNVVPGYLNASSYNMG